MSRHAFALQAPIEFTDEAWIASSPRTSGMRLLVNEAPDRWSPTIRAAARLVDQIDRHHLAGRDDEAADAAIELEGLLGLLAAEGITAWLSS